MDRPTTRKEADASGTRTETGRAFVLPSRRNALDLCRSAVLRRDEPDEGRAGPVLLTGDAGVGKTWLWRRLEAEAPIGARWISVDLTPSDRPGDFYRMIGHELGLIDPGSKAQPPSRVALLDVLEGREADGERVHLVVEEAHNLSGDLWEEVRVLANRLDRPGGFASIVLVGQTSLAVRFATRAFAAMATRLAARLHLGPIGVDEAGELLARARPHREWSADELEILHRDASGNPSKLLRLVQPRPVSPPVAIEAPRPEPVAEVATPRAAASPGPLTGPAKPPIRSDDNMIEVGWSPDESPAPASVEGAPARKPGPPAPSEGGEESVRDHYAALQAWREWTENQVRHAPEAAQAVEVEDEDEIDEEAEEEIDDPRFIPPARADRPTVRAEGEQKFAPFGQLFSRMAQAREPE